MNSRQKAFCEYYAENPDGQAAAIKAGYSPKSSKSIASENLTKPDLLRYIRKLQEQVAAPRIAGIAETKATLSDVMRDPHQKPADRIRAAELLLKSSGAFVRVREDYGGFTVVTAPRDTPTVDGWHDIVYYDPRTSQPEPTDDGDCGTVIYLPIQDRLEDHEPDETDNEREIGG